MSFIVVVGFPTVLCLLDSKTDFDWLFVFDFFFNKLTMFSESLNN